MSQRIIKNYTDSDYTIRDLGEIVVPARGARDIGGGESRLVELASSDDLLAMLVQGPAKYQLNDGINDLSMPEAVDLIRRIDSKTQRDQLGRWIVRVDSRRKNYDTVFIGCGDNIAEQTIGGGPEFRFDMSAPAGDPKWVTAPDGYVRQRIDWQFIDTTYIKEGAIYYFDMPKGAWIDFKFYLPAGYPFFKKRLDAVTSDPFWEDSLTFTTEKTLVGVWVDHHWMEGSCPMGDELNTEAAHENPSPPLVIYSVEVTVPMVEGWEKAHGHFSVELYRGRTVKWPEDN